MKREVNAITEYLNYVDKTGISPVRNFEIEIDGTITQKQKNEKEIGVIFILLSLVALLAGLFFGSISSLQFVFPNF